MLTSTEKNRLRRIWVNTSDPVRDAITTWVQQADHGNLVAEKEAQRFLRLYSDTGSGMRAYDRLYADQGEQLHFE